MAFEGEHVAFIQAQAGAVLTALGIKLFRATVAGIYPDKTINIRRIENIGPDGVAVADDVPAVRLDFSHRLNVGDNIWCFSHQGHAFVLGRHDVRYEFIEDLRAEIDSLKNRSTSLENRATSLESRTDNQGNVISSLNTQLNTFINNHTHSHLAAKTYVDNGFAPVVHNNNNHSVPYSPRGHGNDFHERNYVSFGEGDDRYAPKSHDHDGRYYTKGQSDNRFARKSLEHAH